MVLIEVLLSRDLYLACIQLALSKEKEEVIGLLLGETEEVDGNEKVHLYAMKIPCRLDKKKDRVEISAEQLCATTDYADELKHRVNRDVRVLGWFHSHPHITVWPSHVDLMTQANYQNMCSSFVGLICSVFSENKTTKENNVKVTCFQSEPVNNMTGALLYERRPVPFNVVDNPPLFYGISCLKEVTNLPNILLSEEEIDYEASASGIDKLDAVSKLHNDTLLTQTQLHIFNNVSVPLLKDLEIREKFLKKQLALLHKYGDKLKHSFGGCPENSE